MNEDMTRNVNNDDMTRDPDLGEQGSEHQGQGKLDKLTGKVQEEFGKLTGNKDTELKGKMKQGKGNLEEGAGKAESTIDDALNR